jgi:multidrug efflux pump subunit AcrA (membrane-fusion protein)
MTHKRWLAIPLLMAVLTTALSGCMPDSAMAQAPISERKVPAAPTEGEPTLGGDIVSASGKIVPAYETELAFTTSGRVASVPVAEGDEVKRGDVMVTLETDLLDAGMTQAEMALVAAQAQLPLVQAGPRPGEVAAAEAQLRAAEAALAQAAAQRDQLVAGATEVQIATAQSRLAAAQAEEKAARIAYDQLRDRHVEELEEKTTILRLHAAEQNRIAAEAQLALAKESGPAQVRAAQAAVQTAAAERNAAQARLDLVRAGVTAEEIAIAEAAVAQAEAALQAAQALLGQATLHAPSSGTVTTLEINSGETVMPGQVVLVLANLQQLRVETTDLGEQDVAQVVVGQEATVYIEPLEMEIVGQVIDIASQATTVGGDVVYTVAIELEEQPPGLRWGMSVEVEIATGR